MLVGTSSGSDIKAVQESTSMAQGKDTRSTQELTKAAARQSTSSFRIHVELSAADEALCRVHLSDALKALTGHPIFGQVLSYVMSLRDHALYERFAARLLELGSKSLVSSL